MPSAAAAPEKRPRDAAQQSWRAREKLERDLSFYDVEGTGANGRLSAAQIAAYNRDGYVFPISIFSREEAAANLEYFDRIMAEAEAQGHNNYQVENWMRRCRGMFDLCGSPLSQTGLSGVSLSPADDVPLRTGPRTRRCSPWSRTCSDRTWSASAAITSASCPPTWMRNRSPGTKVRPCGCRKPREADPRKADRVSFVMQMRTTGHSRRASA